MLDKGGQNANMPVKHPRLPHSCDLLCSASPASLVYAMLSASPQTQQERHHILCSVTAPHVSMPRQVQMSPCPDKCKRVTSAKGSCEWRVHAVQHQTTPFPPFQHHINPATTHCAPQATSQANPRAYRMQPQQPQRPRKLHYRSAKGLDIRGPQALKHAKASSSLPALNGLPSHKKKCASVLVFMCGAWCAARNQPYEIGWL
jgi:hypothetical protein